MVILRAGLFERVSTEEQAKFGYSIQTQVDALSEYCVKNEIKIVDHYCDEGVSAGKPYQQRPEMKRLLDDVIAGNIDIILFTRLDRWFRNVPEYFKVQEILDKYDVQWRAIYEDYDTTTANGRMAITIFLAVAQNEREKNAERVKVVLANKRKNKEACFGGPFRPMGYKKEEDENGIPRLVKDPETEEMTQEFWRILVRENNLAAAIRHMSTVYGVEKSPKTWTRIARSPFYCGMWDGIEDFCEPYVSMEDWLMIQETANRRRQDTRSKRTYLFSGMVRCPECGHILCGSYKIINRNGRKYEYRQYRCRFKFTVCGYKHAPTEKKIEKYLLQNIRKHLEEEIVSAEIEKRKPKPKPKIDAKALKERLRRLNVTYIAGNISDEDYLQQDAEIKALLAKAEQEAPQPARDTAPLREILNADFEAIYETLTLKDKRRFWRGIVKEVVFDGKDIVDVKFL